ncbi:cell envelope integrity protein CreD [Parasphingorhabdus sp. DH2-15]|uniref:cell envelope integrity protein CreD n=1 Tax=Parasphingorhabdus sp. DH2-15 TaxID=3444112 RepID=UPI003F6848A8
MDRSEKEELPPSQPPLRKERTPGVKLLIAALIGFLLMIPLLMVYALVYDRQSQSETARESIAEGWGDAQLVTGPVIVIPYDKQTVERYEEDGINKTRTVTVTRSLYLSPLNNTVKVDVDVDAETRQKAIYKLPVYIAQVDGTATFAIPEDVERYGVKREELKFDQAEIRFPVADPRGLLSGNSLSVNGKNYDLRPGNGLAITNGAGFFAFLEWDDGKPLKLKYSYGMKGNDRISLAPRGELSDFTVTSNWAHPNFTGDFLPDERELREDGFTAKYAIANLALGEALVALSDKAPERQIDYGRYSGNSGSETWANSPVIAMVEPVNLYSQVDRAVKYGFLFIGFTFLTFLLFDIIAGARVAAAEYILTGAGLILFFVMLLAFAEVFGFALAYFMAAAAMIILLTAYSGAVLGSRKRAGFVGAILVGLYALLYVLLNQEAYALLVGSMLLFVALAGVMFVTRNIDWSGLARPSKQTGGN